MAKKHSVEIAINARDRATGKMRNISAAARGLSGALRSVAAAAGVGFGLYGIVRGMKALVSVASDAEEINAKFAAVFKEEAEAAEAFGGNLARAVRRSKIDIKSYLATIQDTFVPLGFARDAARSMSQQVVKLAIDLSSFNNVAEPEVIRGLQSALVGNHETMRRYGVVITQATLEQELLNMGMKRGFKNATEQEKALARLNLIVAGTADAQGDAARTANSFANQLRGAKAQIKDASIIIGARLLPAIARVLGSFADLSTHNRIVWAEIKLGVYTTWLDFKHFFGSTIPRVVFWALKYIRDQFINLSQFLQTIFINLENNFFNFGKSIIRWIKDPTGPFAFEWTPLLDGFRVTLEQFPEIARRQTTKIERQMAGRIQGMKFEALERQLENMAGPPAAPPLPGGPSGPAALAAAKRSRQASTFESRFLTLTTRPIDKTASNTSMMTKQLEIANRFLAQVAAATGKGPAVTAAYVLAAARLK